jgi:hypothetical protein
MVVLAHFDARVQSLEESMNPYQPPHPGQAPYEYNMPPPAERERLMRIAADQRAINMIVLIYFGTGVTGTALKQAGGGLQIVIGIIALGVIVAGVVYAVRMASALHGTGMAVLFAILLLIPCVGLIALLVLNSQATAELKRAGLRVGLMGADASQFHGWR